MKMSCRRSALYLPALLLGLPALSMAQTKTLGSTVVSANLDFHAATWTKVTAYVIPLRFNGAVFGETAAF